MNVATFKSKFKIFCYFNNDLKTVCKLNRNVFSCACYMFHKYFF